MTEDRKAKICPNCGAVLGMTTSDGVLFVGDIGIISSEFFCIFCGEVVPWYPSPKVKMDRLLEHARALRESVR